MYRYRNKYTQRDKELEKKYRKQNTELMSLYKLSIMYKMLCIVGIILIAALVTFILTAVINVFFEFYAANWFVITGRVLAAVLFCSSMLAGITLLCMGVTYVYDFIGDLYRANRMYERKIRDQYDE